MIYEDPSNLIEKNVLFNLLIMSLVKTNIAFCVPLLNDTNQIYYLYTCPVDHSAEHLITEINVFYTKLLRVNSCRYNWNVIYLHKEYLCFL